jgi:hypothetical protein
MQSFSNVVYTEILKLRSTFAFWLTLIYPLGTVVLVSLFWIGMRNSKGIHTDEFISNLGNAASFFLPFYIVLVISVACNIEHKSSMLKHILALPVPRPVYYVGKLTGILVYIFFAMILTLAFAYLSIVLCGFISPNLGFGTSFNHLYLIRIILRAYIAAAAIYSIQFWLSMRFRNLTLPLAIGSALIILPIAILIIMGVAGLLQKIDDFTKVITYNPYSYAYSTAFKMMKNTDIILFPSLSILYITLGIAVLAAGAWEINRRNIS